MEKQIYEQVNKLMEIFDVEQPSLGHQWAEQLIQSAKRNDHHIKPINQSLDEIQDKIQLSSSSSQKERNIKKVYNEIVRIDGPLVNGAEMLHLLSNLVSDDNTRKFIKIHNLLRASKAKKLQQQQTNQTAATIEQPFPQTPASINHQKATMSSSSARYQINQQHQPQQQQQQQQQTQQTKAPQTPHQYIPQQSNGFRMPMAPLSVRSDRQNINNTLHLSQDYRPNQQHLHQPHQLQIFQQTPLNQTKPTNFETPRSTQQYRQNHPQTPHYQNNLSTSMVAITPASHKSKREKKKEMRRKNDIMHQKMKAFLAEHPFLSFDYKKIDWSEVPPIGQLSTMSIQEQESALINDLLYVLIGSEGKYIRMQPSRESPNKHTIGVERGGDELVYTSATRIIKICPLYSTVVHYAEDVNFGLVNQALTAPVRDLVKEYVSLISNLQQRALRDELTLQSMWLSLQTIFYKMEALKKILDEISQNSCYGGHTLSVLHDQVVKFSTNPKTHDFCIKLINAASEPYFEILQKWLYLGVIEDPYGEFFIEDTENELDTRGLFSNSLRNNRANNLQLQQNVDADAFWKKRFTCDASKRPKFLEKDQEKRIFDTGQYLSVVRHYGKKVFRPLRVIEPMVYCPDSRSSYDERIDGAYRFASKELLELLLVENKLIERLYSLKRYFLFSSGDFFVQFMDMADEELSKTQEEINMARLESLLELALRTSSCNQDPYKDDVHIEMSQVSLYELMASINGAHNITDQLISEHTHSSSENLVGWESLTLSYDVTWPLSMIICKDNCLDLYKMMFRHLFCCKYVEGKLEAAWRLNRLLKFENCEFAFTLRQRMLHFVNNLLHYITEIIEPSFQLLISKLKDGGIENVNEVMDLHEAFLSSLVHDSMLMDNELLSIVTKLLLLCMNFSAIIEKKFASYERERKHLEGQKLITPKSISLNNLRPSIEVKTLSSDGLTPQTEGTVASIVRRLSTQNNQQLLNTTVHRSESTGNNSKTKSINSDEVDNLRIVEITEKFNTQITLLLNALADRSQDHSASSKLQNLFFRLNFNNFYTKSDLAS